MAGCSPVACQGSFAMATSNDRTGRIPSINPSRTREALLGGLRFWVSVIKASRRARNSASGTAPCALKATSSPSSVLYIAAQLTVARSEEHTSELQSPCNLVCRLLLEKKKEPLTDFFLGRPMPPGSPIIVTCTHVD